MKYAVVGRGGHLLLIVILVTRKGKDFLGEIARARVFAAPRISGAMWRPRIQDWRTTNGTVHLHLLCTQVQSLIFGLTRLASYDAIDCAERSAVKQWNLLPLILQGTLSVCKSSCLSFSGHFVGRSSWRVLVLQCAIVGFDNDTCRQNDHHLRVHTLTDCDSGKGDNVYSHTD